MILPSLELLSIIKMTTPRDSAHLPRFMFPLLLLLWNMWDEFPCLRRGTFSTLLPPSRCRRSPFVCAISWNDVLYIWKAIIRRRRQQPEKSVRCDVEIVAMSRQNRNEKINNELIVEQKLCNEIYFAEEKTSNGDMARELKI